VTGPCHSQVNKWNATLVICGGNVTREGVESFFPSAFFYYLSLQLSNLHFTTEDTCQSLTPAVQSLTYVRDCLRQSTVFHYVTHCSVLRHVCVLDLNGEAKPPTSAPVFVSVINKEELLNITLAMRDGWFFLPFSLLSPTRKATSTVVSLDFLVWHVYSSCQLGGCIRRALLHFLGAEGCVFRTLSTVTTFTEAVELLQPLHSGVCSLPSNQWVSGTICGGSTRFG